jgi:hypothetical protein
MAQNCCVVVDGEYEAKAPLILTQSVLAIRIGPYELKESDIAKVGIAE